MKKIILILLSILYIGVIGCSEPAKKTPLKTDINKIIAIELEHIDKNYSEETLKALSVILRTNQTINNKEVKDITPSQKYLDIAQKTKNEVIMDKNNNLIEISLVDNDEYRWQKTIKKSKILEFALKHKINLSNISDIKPVYENEKVKGLEIGGKLFDYQMLITEFGLESNTIEKIETTKTEVIIQGKNKGLFDNFSTYKSEQLSNDNHNYKDILKIFFNDLKIN